MNRYFFNLLLAGAISLAPISSFGMGQFTPPSDKYASLEDIPLPLMKNLQGYMQTREQYIASILSPIRQSGRTKLSLDQQDMDAIKKKSSDDRRRQVLSQFISYDYDFDGGVTREDIKNMMSTRNSFSSVTPDQNFDLVVSKTFAQLLVYDANHDDIITYEEVRSSPLPITPRGRDFDSRGPNELGNLLSLDPNKDGKLTADELEILARKAYKTIDTNGDGLLSPDEVKPLGDIQRKLSELNSIKGAISNECRPLTQMPTDEKIIKVGVYEGDVTSSVSIAGQSAVTRIIPVYVEPGKDKIYLVASSYVPIIWKLSGATDRISHLVLAGPSIPEGSQNTDTGGDKVNAGVIGASVKNVEFRHARLCGLGYRDNLAANKADDVVMQQLVGRKADISLSQYKMLDLTIGSEGQLTQNNANTSITQSFDKMPAPKGFDTATWRKSLIYSGGGISFEKADRVISEVKAQNYTVLPAWFGISKLINDGVLVPVNDLPQTGNMLAIGVPKSGAYKIVKEMPSYPAGLTGALSATFILGKGINPPKGDIGHSCLISEETGKGIIGASPLCR